MESVAAGYQRITEGSASMNYELRGADTRTRGTGETDGPVFYNKVQVFNRDLSVLMISLFAQWRYVERAERRARRAAATSGLDGAAAGAAERERLYALSASELDALLKAEAASDGIRVLDALAATGLRSIRYAKEIPGVRKVVANDVDEAAAAACGRNVVENGAAELCEAHCGDAVEFMATSRNKGKDQTFDVIDLDPYGSAAPFIDAAVQAVSDGGLLCVTSTDMTVLSGNYPEVCFAKYGSMPTKAKHLHEFALRVLVHAIETSAARYAKHVQPVLCLSIDFYIRVFVRVYKRPAEVKKTASKRAFVLQSAGCPSFYLQPLARALDRDGGYAPALLHRKPVPKDVGERQTARERRREKKQAASAAAPHEPGAEPPEAAAPAPAPAPPPAAAAAPEETVAPAFCNETGAAFKIGGPIWAAPLHDRDWVLAALDRIDNACDAHLSTQERLHGMLTAVSEELLDVPLYYTLPDICAALHCSSPKMAEVKAALSHAGYRVSQHHRDPDAIKTDAPPRVLWDVFRCWVKKHPVSEKRLADANSAAAKILAIEPKLEANFATTAAMRNKATKARRWAPNPEPYWGPKAAARGRKAPKLH